MQRSSPAIFTGPWYGWEINFYFVRPWKFFFGIALNIIHPDNFSVKSGRIIPGKFIKFLNYCDIWNLPFKVLEMLCRPKKYLIFYLSSQLHYMRANFLELLKTFEVQLTLACKAEKDKHHWKSEFLRWHPLNSCSRMLVPKSFFLMALWGKHRSSQKKKRFHFILFKIWNNKTF